MDGNLLLLRELNASGAIHWRDALFEPIRKPIARRLASFPRRHAERETLAASLARDGASFLRVSAATDSGAATAPPLSMLVLTFATQGGSATLCTAFADRLRRLQPSLCQSLMHVELLLPPAANRSAQAAFVQSLSLKLNAISLLQRSLTESLPLVVSDCDVVVFRPDAIARLLRLCARNDICFMHDAAGGAGIGPLNARTRSGVNGGLLVMPDARRVAVRRLVDAAASNLSATIDELGPEGARRLLPLGDQDVYQRLLRAPSLLPWLRWAIIPPQHVGLGCRSVPLMRRHSILLGHATLQRPRLYGRDSARVKLACLKEMQRWVETAKLKSCISAWKMPHPWLTSTACLAACPPLPDETTNCTCRDRRKSYPAWCKKFL
jgi:hypothetical protein